MIKTAVYSVKPFGGNVYFYYGDYDDYLKCIHGKIDGVEEARLKKADYREALGLTSYRDKNCYIYLNPEQDLISLVGTICHEVLHAIFAITDIVGYNYNIEGQELYCYYMNSMVEFALKQFNLIKIKVENEDKGQA